MSQSRIELRPLRIDISVLATMCDHIRAAAGEERDARIRVTRIALGDSSTILIRILMETQQSTDVRAQFIHLRVLIELATLIGNFDPMFLRDLADLLDEDQNESPRDLVDRAVAQLLATSSAFRLNLDEFDRSCPQIIAQSASETTIRRRANAFGAEAFRPRQ